MKQNLKQWEYVFNLGQNQSETEFKTVGVRHCCKSAVSIVVTIG